MFKWLGKACRLTSGRRAALATIAITLSTLSTTPLRASGDLLIAPTRVILDSRRGTEVILNNIGDEEATYRVSLELRRMNDQGLLNDVEPEAANEQENAALGAIRYAPRRVTLPPNQPQSIRIGMQPNEVLPDGEYRAHMLFRAIPKTPVANRADEATEGFKIQITPIYGISIPVIVRKGNLQVTAALNNVRFGKDDEGPTLEFDINRSGKKSLFGEIHVSKPGAGQPLSVTKGIAVYPEITRRTVSVPLTPQIAAQLRGEVIISYFEAPEAGGGLISQVRSVLP